MGVDLCVGIKTPYYRVCRLAVGLQRMVKWWVPLLPGPTWSSGGHLVVIGLILIVSNIIAIAGSKDALQQISTQKECWDIYVKEMISGANL